MSNDGWDDNPELTEALNDEGNDANVDVTDDVDMNDTTQDVNDEFAEETGDGWNDDGDGDWGEFDDGDQKKNVHDMKHPQSDFHVDNKIPTVTVEAITNNCIEINMIPLFSAVPDLKSRARIGAVIGIRIDKLSNITQEQLEVWNITPEYPYIGIKFEFGPFYLNEGEKPKISVGMMRELRPDEDLKSFRLSWTILERCKNVMLSSKQWPPKIDMKNIPDASTINDLMEGTQKEYALCLEAMINGKNIKDIALNSLIDESQAKLLEKNLPSLEKCSEEFRSVLSTFKLETTTKDKDDKKEENNKKKQKESFWKKQYQDASNDSKAYQLAEMFSIPVEAAQMAIETYGYEKAVTELVDVETRENFLAMMTIDKDETFEKVEDFLGTFGGEGRSTNKSGNNKQGKDGFLSGFFRGSKNKKEDDDLEELKDIEPMMRTQSDNNIQEVNPKHMLRTIAVMMQHNFLLRVLTFALKVLMNGNKYCMICDDPLDFAGLKPSICTKPFCQFRHDSIGLGFSLASEIVYRPEITDLLVSLCYAACLNQRITIFFPESVRGQEDHNQDESILDSSGKPDVSKLQQLLNDCPSMEEMKPWASEGDPTLKKKLGEISCLLYPLLCWIVTSNRAHLRVLNEKEQVKGIKADYQFALASATPAKEAEFQNVQRLNGSFLAFHGSPMGNWHSILRMGLKNYSNTKQQLHGAAYGSGIYLASNFSTSAGYCRYSPNNSWPKSMYGPSLSCMALCEVCYHDEDVKKNTVNKSASALDSTDIVTVSTSKSLNTTQKTTTTQAVKTVDAKNRWIKTPGIYVVDKEECVMTRFFLVFKGQMGQLGVEANSLDIPRVVKASK